MPPGPVPSGPAKMTQAQRLDAARRARVQKSRNTRFAIVGGVVVLVGLIIFNTLSNRADTNALRARLTAGGCEFDTRSDDIDPPPNNHVAPAGYDVDPPAGGNHAPGASPAGTFTDANKPADAGIVHSLEHGYIAIWHRPDLPEADMTAITDAIKGSERDVLIVPRASITGKVAATAWGERLLCGEVETAPLKEFVETYANKGPERIEHPAL